MEIYYQPHKARKREWEFVQSLIQKHNIPAEKIFKHTYSLPIEYVEKTLNTADVIEYINNSDLSGKRKHKLLIELEKLPAEVKVWKKGFKISCDVTLVKNGLPEFYEFHEEQHWRLPGNRKSKIYDLNGNILIVPRFLQRYLRDCWRLKKLEPMHIIFSK